MKHSLGARWRALLIVAVLTLSACSERSDPKRRWNGSRRGTASARRRSPGARSKSTAGWWRWRRRWPALWPA